MEAACDLQGFQRPLRQSVIVVDERALTKSPDVAQLREANQALFDLVMNLGTPSRSLPTGVMAPRERLTILLAPADGGATRLLFTGCLPGFSAAEVAARKAGRSKVGELSDKTLTGGDTARLDKQAAGFATSLQQPLVALTRGQPVPTGRSAFAQSSLVRSLQSAPQLVPQDDGVPRLFIFTDLRQFRSSASDAATARSLGFAAGREAGLKLGRVEAHLVGPAAGDALSRQFAEAFLLESGARLQSWGAATFNGAPPAPVRVRNFTGEIDYGSDRLPLKLRLGTDATGTLVDSWIVVNDAREVATPLSGQLSCDSEQRCRLISDEGGLAQAWSLAPGGEPELGPEMPLGGLRSLEAAVADGRLSGRVFDAAVRTINGGTGLPITAVEN